MNMQKYETLEVPEVNGTDLFVKTIVERFKDELLKIKRTESSLLLLDYMLYELSREESLDINAVIKKLYEEKDVLSVKLVTFENGKPKLFVQRESGEVGMC